MSFHLSTTGKAADSCHDIHDVADGDRSARGDLSHGKQNITDLVTNERTGIMLQTNSKSAAAVCIQNGAGRQRERVRWSPAAERWRASVGTHCSMTWQATVVVPAATGDYPAVVCRQ